MEERVKKMPSETGRSVRQTVDGHRNLGRGESWAQHHGPPHNILGVPAQRSPVSTRMLSKMKNNV